MIDLNFQVSDPINYKLKIIGLARKCTNGETVVPDDWLYREFDSAEQLHKEIDKLPNRQNKPPVTYCVIYSMILVKENAWTDNIENIKVKNIVQLNCLIKDDRELLIFLK